MLCRILLLTLLGFGFGCRPAQELRDADRPKLDPVLQKLLAGAPVVESEVEVSLRENGEKAYSVIITASDQDALRKADIQIDSVFGKLVTARVTLAELHKLLAIDGVEYIQNSAKNYPQ